MQIFAPMISVAEAISRIKNNTSPLKAINFPLAKACGFVLAEDAVAGVSVPPFNQSAMDGYAFRFADFLLTKELTVGGKVAAGDNADITLPSGSAVRIFTGAPVPHGFDTVVMQEKTSVKGNRLSILDDQLEIGSNVRKKGVEIAQNSLALPKGTCLSPAAIGYLAGSGLTEVMVYPKPVVHIIVTGKELQHPGNALQPGQIYESNSMVLQSALEQLHILDVSISFASDDEAEIAGVVQEALMGADLILLSGGVSVGDYDFVVGAVASCGVEQLFHKIAQRPGKPLYAGQKEGKLVFGLPGNPASVLTCFYQYVTTAIEGLTGRKAMLEKRKVPLLADINKKIGLTQFLRATCTSEGVMPLTSQESFRLSSFSVANCLIILPEEVRDYKAGDTVEVLLLPYL